MNIDASLRHADLPLVRLDPFYAQMVSSPRETCRALSRSSQLLQRYEAARRRAAATYELTQPMLNLYRQLVDDTSALLADDPTLQHLGDLPVPLVADGGLSQVSLNGSLRDVFLDVCADLGIDANHVLESWTDSGPKGGSFVAFDNERYVLHSPNTRDLGGLVRLTHEAGHWLYETRSGHTNREATARYLESEACATLLCRVAVSRAIQLGHAATGPGSSHQRAWMKHAEAEDFLNAHFFLEEASQLGLPVPPLRSISHRHLRESRTMFLGYQVVYAGASVMIRQDRHRVWSLLSPP